jgi:hypothetical protein
VRDIHHTLANAAFDAYLLGAWNTSFRDAQDGPSTRATSTKGRAKR